MQYLSHDQAHLAHIDRQFLVLGQVLAHIDQQQHTTHLVRHLIVLLHRLVHITQVHQYHLVSIIR